MNLTPSQFSPEVQFGHAVNPLDAAARDFWEHCIFKRRKWFTGNAALVKEADALLAAWRERFDPRKEKV